MSNFVMKKSKSANIKVVSAAKKVRRGAAKMHGATLVRAKKVRRGKVLVGMSGGVDSSVTACLLQEQGYEVIGIHLKFWVDPTVFSVEKSQQFPQNKCCTLEGLTRTRQIAARIGIPFYVLNFEEIFKEKVVDTFIEGYGRGVTPNPCIECNRFVKFGFFLQKMKELGADYIATGHYARKVTVRENGHERHELWMARDKSKDQSYFLYVLNQQKLKHILFPLGDYTKAEVRVLAKKYGIEEVNKQRESQNLCFFPERNHGAFLKRYLNRQKFAPGPIMTTQGRIVGTHQGLPIYTIGQRKGLGIGGVKDMADQEGNPWYVVQLDMDRNALIVGRRDELYQQKFNAHTLSWVADEDDGEAKKPALHPTPARIRYHAPLQQGAKKPALRATNAHIRNHAPLQQGTQESEISSQPQSIHARIRYHAALQPASLKIQMKASPPSSRTRRGNGQQAFIEFQVPQPAITAGQSVVFYEGEKVLGGGIIE